MLNGSVWDLSKVRVARRSSGIQSCGRVTSMSAQAMLRLLTTFLEIAFGRITAVYACAGVVGTVTRPEAISAVTDSCIDSRLENRGLYPRR
jgi:hypothetical protein